MKYQCILCICILLSSCSDAQKAKSLYNRAFAQYIEKNFTTAKELCIQSINEAKTPEALLLLSKIYFFTNDTGFKDTVRQYISLTNSTQGYILYARWYIRQNKSRKAQELLNKALIHSPHDPTALYLLGNLQYADKEYDDAILTFHKAFINYHYIMLIHKKLASIYSDIGLEERSLKHTAMVRAITDFDIDYTMEK